jgi:hypothetical protein
MGTDERVASAREKAQALHAALLILEALPYGATKQIPVKLADIENAHNILTMLRNGFDKGLLE